MSKKRRLFAVIVEDKIAYRSPRRCGALAYWKGRMRPGSDATLVEIRIVHCPIEWSEPRRATDET